MKVETKHFTNKVVDDVDLEKFDQKDGWVLFGSYMNASDEITVFAYRIVPARELDGIYTTDSGLAVPDDGALIAELFNGRKIATVCQTKTGWQSFYDEDKAWKKTVETAEKSEWKTFHDYSEWEHDPKHGRTNFVSSKDGVPAIVCAYLDEGVKFSHLEQHFYEGHLSDDLAEIHNNIQSIVGRHKFIPVGMYRDNDEYIHILYQQPEG